MSWCRSLAIVGALVVVGCASEESPPEKPASAAKASVPSDATALVFRLTGGMPYELAGSNPASTCTSADDAFTLTLATRLFAWTRCDKPAGADGYTMLSDSRTLEPSEVDGLLALVGGMTRAAVPERDACWVDFPAFSVDVQSPSSSETYRVGTNNACSGEPGIYVDATSALELASEVAKLGRTN
jgi:hypothetical protein